MVSNRHAPVSDANARAVAGARPGPSRVAWLALLPLLAAACATTPIPQPAVVYEDYKVGAPDTLMVTVLPEPAIQEQAVVRPDGKITIQLIGDVQAAGRTPDDIAAEIDERIGRFKRGARTTVAVTSAVSSAITVLGEVRGPGTFPMLKGTRVAEAIGGAGGTTFLANIDGIRIVRGTEASARVITVDLAAIRGGDMSTNVQLHSGDIVYVPPHFLAKIGYAVQSVLFPFQPVIGIARTAGIAAAVQ